MADALAITPHASASETTTGQGPAVDMGVLRTAARLELIVGTVSGTDRTLDVNVQTSPDGLTAWRDAGAFVRHEGQGSHKRTFGDLDRWIRVRFVIGGTLPNFTFSVAGFAEVTYADPADLSKTSINADALKGIAPEVLAECCLRATSDAETALNSAYTLPLTAWDSALRGVVADRAMFYAISHRGIDPTSAGNALIMENGGKVFDGNRSAAERWFDGVATGGKKPPGIVDSTPDVFEAASAVVSSAVPRGW